jgi:hypothetical protein
MIKRLMAVFVFFISVSCFCSAQQLGTQNEMALHDLPLNSKPVLTDAGVVASFGPMLCDGSGTIYIRFFTSGDPLQAPITRISASGQTSRIELPRIFGERPPLLLFFTVTPDGDLYELLRIESLDADRKLQFTTHLAVFSRTGTLKTKSQFPFNFLPSMLVPLANDEVLAGGAKLETDDEGSEVRKPFLGVFSSSGQMTRELVVPSPILSPSQKEQGAVNPALEYGKAHIGPDGNLYLLFASSPPVMEVWSSSGKFLRKLRLVEPFDSSRVHNFFVSARYVLVVFSGPKTDQHGPWAYVLYDNETADSIRAYKPAFSGVPVCWDGNQLKVIVAEKDRTGFLVGTASLP